MMDSIFQPNLLRDKIAVITGGGSGINFAIAKRFAQHGAKVVLLGRSEEKLDRAVAEIQKQGGTALGIALDVRDYSAVAAAFSRVSTEIGPVNILVCGAAGNFPAA